MPDYDPKNIPILDDIIENDAKSKNADAITTSDGKIIPEQISTDIAGAEKLQDDNTLDLFNDKTTDFKVGNSEPESGVIDKFIGDINEDSEAIGIENSETETVDSALIDYQVVEDENDSEQQDDQIGQAQTIAGQSTIAEQTITLDSIADDVVKQLLPDLEQQLRFLVQQALEEKLPEEVIRQMSPKNDE